VDFGPAGREQSLGGGFAATEWEPQSEASGSLLVRFAFAQRHPTRAVDGLVGWYGAVEPKAKRTDGGFTSVRAFPRR